MDKDERVQRQREGFIAAAGKYSEAHQQRAEQKRADGNSHGASISEGKASAWTRRADLARDRSES